MNYGWFHWLVANAFCPAVSEAYDNSEGYFLGQAHLDWLWYFECQNCYLIVTNSLDVCSFLTSCNRRDCPRFRTALGARAWMLGYKLLVLSRGSTRAYSPSFVLWIFWTPTKMAIGEHLRRLALLVGVLHGPMDVHQDAIIWDKPWLPADYQKWKKFGLQFWSDFVRLERRSCLRLGVFTQLHQPELVIFPEKALMSKIFPSPKQWQRWEVPQDFRTS